MNKSNLKTLKFSSVGYDQGNNSFYLFAEDGTLHDSYHCRELLISAIGEYRRNNPEKDSIIIIAANGGLGHRKRQVFYILNYVNSLAKSFGYSTKLEYFTPKFKDIEEEDYSISIYAKRKVSSRNSIGVILTKEWLDFPPLISMILLILRVFSTRAYRYTSMSFQEFLSFLKEDFPKTPKTFNFECLPADIFDIKCLFINNCKNLIKFLEYFIVNKEKILRFFISSYNKSNVWQYHCHSLGMRGFLFRFGDSLDLILACGETHFENLPKL